MSRPKKRKTSGPNVEDEDSIWDFIHDNICNMDLYEDVDQSLLEQYLKENNVAWSIRELTEYYETRMQRTLYRSDLPAKKVLDLYKKLEIQITPHVEEAMEKRFGAVLRVDSDGFLRSFSIYSKNVDRSGEKLTEIEPERAVDTTEIEPEKRRKMVFGVPSDLEISPTFESEIWKFIVKNTNRLTGTMLLSEEFWQEFVDQYQEMPIKSGHLLLHHFSSRMVENMYKQEMDPEKKLQLLKDLRVPMTLVQKRWIMSKDGIKVTSTIDGFIKKWEVIERNEEEDVTSPPPPPPPQPRTHITWIPRTSSTSAGYPDGASTSGPQPTRPLLPAASHDPTPHRHLPFRPPATPAFPNHDSKNLDAARHAKTSPSNASDFGGSVGGGGGKPKRGVFTVDDQLFAWRYVYKRMYETLKNREKEPVMPKGLDFWNTFVMKWKSSKTAANWSSHFRKQMCPKLHEMPLPRDTILFLFSKIDIEVDHRVHQILEKKCNAKITVVDMRVTSWKYRDVNGGGGGVDSDEDNMEIDTSGDDSDDSFDVDRSSLNTTQPMDEAMVEIDDDADITLEMPEMAEIPEPTTPPTRNTAENQEAGRKSAVSPKTTSKTANLAENLAKTVNLKSNTPKSTRKPQNLSPESPEITRIDQQEPRRSPRKSARSSDRNSLNSRLNRPKSPQQMQPRTSISPRKSMRLERNEPKTPEKLEKSMKSPEKSTKRQVAVIPDSMDLFQATQSEPGTSTQRPPIENPEKSKKIDLNSFNTEFMKSAELLEVMQKTMGDVGDDDVGKINEAIQMAFGKENWDQDGTCENVAFNAISTTIRENSTGQFQHFLQKNQAELVAKSMAHVENRLVFEKRTEAIQEVLKKKLEEKAAREEEEDDDVAGQGGGWSHSD